jgi:hypothetical protein
MAALHLIHGEYDDRPKRAIMINAGGDPNFVESFASQQNAPDAAPFLEMILCAALVNAQKKSSRGIAARTWNFFSNARRRLLNNSCSAPTVAPVAISLQGAESLESGIGRPTAIRTDLPLLIIDDYPESEANKTFLSRLYTQAAATNITVLVLTKDSEWANKLIKKNGGVKILPMDEIIRNPRGDRVTPFVEVPEWTGMSWTLEDLRKFAATLGDPDISADLVEGMTPTKAKCLHARRELG